MVAKGCYPKAMILAAGRGERLRPLTDTTPKPLVPVKNKPLIVYHLEKLAEASITEVVINLWHLGDNIKKYLGNGSAFGLNIVYSEETELLETGGGICKALPLLGEQDFILLNGDIFTNYDFSQLIPTQIRDRGLLGHLVLVPNPEHHLSGDYGMDNQGRVNHTRTYTYSGIAKLSPQLFLGQTVHKFRLPDLFMKAMLTEQISGELYKGFWYDVGSIERLRDLESKI
jgi:MurNAc alpha-1-phosphate uridylyltransferase